MKLLITEMAAKLINLGFRSHWTTRAGRAPLSDMHRQTCVIVKFGQHLENADSSVNVGTSPAASLLPAAFNFSPVDPKSITLFFSGSDIPIVFRTELRLNVLFFSGSAIPNVLFIPANIFETVFD